MIFYLVLSLIGVFTWCIHLAKKPPDNYDVQKTVIKTSKDNYVNSVRKDQVILIDNH